MGDTPSFTDADYEATCRRAESNTSIKYGLLAKFSPTPPPAAPRKEAVSLFNIKGDTKTKVAAVAPTILNRDPNTIYISQNNYHALNTLESLDSLPGVMFRIVSELSNTGKTEELFRVFDVIKPHIALFKKSDIGGYILRLMIEKNYFKEETNQSFLRSFFHDLPRESLRELMQDLFKNSSNRPKIMSTLIEICRYTEEEINTLLQ